jgi:hypothetical protein
MGSWRFERRCLGATGKDSIELVRNEVGRHLSSGLRRHNVLVTHHRRDGSSEYQYSLCLTSKVSRGGKWRDLLRQQEA